jgi:hypothetical protein
MYADSALNHCASITLRRLYADSTLTLSWHSVFSPFTLPRRGASATAAGPATRRRPPPPRARAAGRSRRASGVGKCAIVVRIGTISTLSRICQGPRRDEHPPGAGGGGRAIQRRSARRARAARAAPPRRRAAPAQARRRGGSGGGEKGEAAEAPRRAGRGAATARGTSQDPAAAPPYSLRVGFILTLRQALAFDAAAADLARAAAALPRRKTSAHAGVRAALCAPSSYVVY